MKIERIYESAGERSVFRCSICNTVNNQDIETNLGDYSSRSSFVHDPSSPHTSFICTDCDEAIRDIRYDYQLMDEFEDE